MPSPSSPPSPSPSHPRHTTPSPPHPSRPTRGPASLLTRTIALPLFPCPVPTPLPAPPPVGCASARRRQEVVVRRRDMRIEGKPAVKGVWGRARGRSEEEEGSGARAGSSARLGRCPFARGRGWRGRLGPGRRRRGRVVACRRKRGETRRQHASLGGCERREATRLRTGPSLRACSCPRPAPWPPTRASRRPRCCRRRQPSRARQRQ